MYLKCTELILDPTQALDLTARMAAVAALVSSLEMIAARRSFAFEGIFHLSGVQSLRWQPSRLLQVLGGRELPVLAVATAGCLGLVLAGPYRLIGRLGLVLALVARMAMAQRRIVGSDGAEQLITLTLVPVALATLPIASPIRIDMAVAFVGGQLVLSYITSGLAKLISPAWRNGSAIHGILHTQTYGLQAAARALDRMRHGNLVLGWVVMLFETSFILLIFAPDWMVVVALLLAFAFHLSCAVIMGLNDFLLAFPAAYPCVAILAHWL